MAATAPRPRTFEFAWQDDGKGGSTGAAFRLFDDPQLTKEDLLEFTRLARHAGFRWDVGRRCWCADGEGNARQLVAVVVEAGYEASHRGLWPDGPPERPRQ